MDSLTPPWEIKREELVRIEAETDWSYGEDPNKRPVEKLLRLGVINLDKHRGPTSHEVAATLKQIIGVDNAGHGGTLGESLSLGISRCFRRSSDDVGGGY